MMDELVAKEYSFGSIPGSTLREEGVTSETQLGNARLFACNSVRKAPNAPRRGDANYVYNHAVVTF